MRVLGTEPTGRHMEVLCEHIHQSRAQVEIPISLVRQRAGDTRDVIGQRDPRLHARRRQRELHARYPWNDGVPAQA